MLKGNPNGRAVEKEDSQTRYWYNGLGCGVMLAAMYLIRDLHKANISLPIRLFDGSFLTRIAEFLPITRRMSGYCETLCVIR